MVRHGHIMIGTHKVDIPSYYVRSNDVIGMRNPESGFIQECSELTDETKLVSWLNAENSGKKIRVNRLPAAEDVAEIPINTQLIVELYSK
jgi:small subunit ribosomal protein S4